jgi:hypothetical protein
MHKAEKTKKGITMNTSSDKKQTNEKNDFPYISRHFAKRYFERILGKPVPNKFHRGIYKGIRKDMDERMLAKEKMTLELFSKSRKALVPIARFNKVVVRKNTLITVY